MTLRPAWRQLRPACRQLPPARRHLPPRVPRRIPVCTGLAHFARGPGAFCARAWRICARAWRTCARAWRTCARAWRTCARAWRTCARAWRIRARAWRICAQWRTDNPVRPPERTPRGRHLARVLGLTDNARQGRTREVATRVGSHLRSAGETPRNGNSSRKASAEWLEMERELWPPYVGSHDTGGATSLFYRRT